MGQAAGGRITRSSSPNHNEGMHYLDIIKQRLARPHYREKLQELWRQRAAILILSAVVGAISGTLAVLLKAATHTIYQYTCGWAAAHPRHFWILPAVPTAGIFACILLVKIFRQNRPYEKSLAGVIQATSNGTSNLPFYHTFAHLITSSLAVGAGASAGLEAPIALTGSAVGSNLAKALQLGRESRTLLLACGGAAGIAAVFSSPVAGILFACEVLLPSFSTPALVPLLMASASGSVISQLLYPGHTFIQVAAPWQAVNIPYYLIIGLSCGLFSAYTIRATTLITRKFEQYHHVWLKGAAGCALLYLLFFLFPALMGEGYAYINALAHDNVLALAANSPLAELGRHPWTLVLLLVLLFLGKPIASALSLESGGDGGIFGPSLCCGAFLGYALYLALTELGINGLSPLVFICSGMGGVIAGVMHAPLTGIFLIAELTGSFQLFIPLMLVTALSSFISKSLTRYNIYKTMIAQKGETPEPPIETLMLTHTKANEIIENDFQTVSPDDSLRTLLKTIMQSRRNIFPVVNAEAELVGIIREESVRPFILNPALYDIVLVDDMMVPTGPQLKPTDSLEDAARLMDSQNLWHLPITRNGQYLGFISKAGILNAYRNLLRQQSELF